MISELVVMALLFAILTPGVLVYLPPGSSRRVSALFHGVVFAVVWYFIRGPVLRLLSSFEGMESKDDKKKH